jgi:hypothetical protein
MTEETAEVKLAEEVYIAFEEVAKKIATFLAPQFELLSEDRPEPVIKLLDILSSVWPIIRSEKFEGVDSISFDRHDLVEFCLSGIFIQKIYKHSPEALEKFVDELPTPNELFQAIAHKGKIQ